MSSQCDNNNNVNRTQQTQGKMSTVHISTAMDIYLTHRAHCSLEDQAKLPGLGDNLIVGLLWE